MNRSPALLHGARFHSYSYVLVVLFGLCFSHVRAMAAACDPVGPFGVPGIVGFPEQVGRWSAVSTWPAVATHATLLNSGKVLWWRRGEPTRTYIWDPVTNTHDASRTIETNVFCAGHATLPNGQVFVAGGEIDFTNAQGAPDSHIFDSVTETWTRGADMTYGRWYPTVTTLPDGRVMAMSGDIAPGVNAVIPEVYDPLMDTWTTMDSASQGMPRYPFNFILPDGRLLTAGPSSATRMLNLQTGIWETLAVARHESAPAGSAAMYQPGKVLRIGGGNPATNNVDVLDMTAASPAWREVAPMAYPRRRPDLVLLPDGTALAVGGSTAGQSDPECAVHAPELWNPVSETWTTLTSMERTRVYHSSALLLADGRVLAAGGENTTLPTGENNAEIFSPPYLFKGPRPVIAGAPVSIDYDTPFNFNVEDRESITAVTLLRPGSVTHNFDHNQRFMSLNFELGNGKKKLRVTGPANANVAPPGTYMLFAINAAGVPSVARFVSLGAVCQSTEVPETSCSDGIDNDCDGQADDNDSDCAAGMCDNDGLCELEENCQSCPGDCDGKLNGRPINRFCCGDGTLQPAEGDGSICDGNP